MSVRRLSLSEWFLYHQLRHIERNHFHLDGLLDVDLSAVATAWQGQYLPLTPILVKAMGLTLRHEPTANRQFLHTFWGPRMLQASQCNVNLPILLEQDGEPYLSVTVIKEADQKSIEQIQADIRAYRKTRKQDLPVGRFIIGKPNTFFNRSRLRLIHWLVNRFPQFQQRAGAGTASVSSLLNLEHAGTTVAITGRGPGALSLTACHYNPQTQQLRLALAWDHYTANGIDGARIGMTLCRVLQNELAPEALFPDPLSTAEGQAL